MYGLLSLLALVGMALWGGYTYEGDKKEEEEKKKKKKEIVCITFIYSYSHDDRTVFSRLL